PDPRDAFDDLRPQSQRRPLSFLLERRPDEEQRDERRGIRDRVGEEREEMRESIQRPAERLAGKICSLLARLITCNRNWKLRLRNDVRQSRGLRQTEKDEQRSLDKCSGDDLRKRR